MHVTYVRMVLVVLPRPERQAQGTQVRGEIVGSFLYREVILPENQNKKKELRLLFFIRQGYTFSFPVKNFPIVLFLRVENHTILIVGELSGNTATYTIDNSWQSKRANSEIAGPSYRRLKIQEHQPPLPNLVFSLIKMRLGFSKFIGRDKVATVVQPSKGLWLS